MKSQAIALAAAALAAATVGLLTTRQSANDTGAASPPTEVGGHGPSSRAAGHLGLRPPHADAGERRLVYRLRSKTGVTMGADDGPVTRFDVTMAGELAATEVALSNDSMVLQLDADTLTIRTEQRIDGAVVHSSEQRSPALEQPFYAAYGADGRLEQVFVPPLAELETRNFMRVLAATLQLSPAPAGTSAWSAVEIRDGSETEVEYRMTGTNRYQKTFDTGSRRGEANLVVSRDRLTAVDGRETAREPELGVAGETTLKLELLTRGRGGDAADAWRRDRSSYVPVGVAPEVDRAAAERAGHLELDDGTTTGDLLAMLQATPADADGGRARNYLLRRLAARFALHPDEAAEAARAARDLEPEQAATVIGALSSVSGEPTERALIELAMDETLPPEIAGDAANALTFHEAPSQAAEDALDELSKSDDPARRNPGLLGLGSIAETLGNQEPDRASRLVEDLLHRFRSATTEEELVEIMGALGNTGSPAILPAVRAALASESPRLAHEAVVALRLVPGNEAEEILRTVLASGALDTRLAALFAARFRPLAPLLPSLSLVLRQDDSAAVRGETVELLGAALAHLPGALALVQHAADRDPNEEIRARARELLASA